MSRSIVSRIGLAAIAGCVAVGALALAGCGGSSSTTTATGASGASGASGSAPLSKDEFVSQANAICADVNKQIEALQAPPANAQLSDVVPVLTQGIAITRAAEAKLEALVPPSELQQERDQLVSDARKKTALAEQGLTAAKAGDVSKYQALNQQVDAINKQADQIATSIGLTECAKSVQPQG